MPSLLATAIVETMEAALHMPPPASASPVLADLGAALLMAEARIHQEVSSDGPGLGCKGRLRPHWEEGTCRSVLGAPLPATLLCLASQQLLTLRLPPQSQPRCPLEPAALTSKAT